MRQVSKGFLLLKAMPDCIVALSQSKLRAFQSWSFIYTIEASNI